MQNNSDIDVIQRIISYCNEISETILRFGADYPIFSGDSVYKNATALKD